MSMSTQCLDEAPSVHRRKWCGRAIPLPSDLQNISTASHPEQNSAPCSGPPNPTRSNTGIQERLWCWQHCMQDGNARHLEISRRYQETCGCATVQDPFISYKETIYSKKHQRHWSPQFAPASQTLQRCGDEMHWNILTESEQVTVGDVHMYPPILSQFYHARHSSCFLPLPRSVKGLTATLLSRLFSGPSWFNLTDTCAISRQCGT